MTMCDKHKFYDRVENKPCKECLRELGEFEGGGMDNSRYAMGDGERMLSDLAIKMMKYSSYSVEDVVRMADRIAALEAENARLNDELDDIKEAYKQVMSERCPTDEVHCTCVPFLRAELAELRDAAKWYLEVCMSYNYISSNSTMAGWDELDAIHGEAERTLRALLSQNKKDS